MFSWSEEGASELPQKMVLYSSCRSIQVSPETNSSVFSLLKLFWGGFCKHRTLLSPLSALGSLSSSKHLLIKKLQNFSPVEFSVLQFSFQVLLITFLKTF